MLTSNYIKLEWVVYIYQVYFSMAVQSHVGLPWNQTCLEPKWFCSFYYMAMPSNCDISYIILLVPSSFDLSQNRHGYHIAFSMAVPSRPDGSRNQCSLRPIALKSWPPLLYEYRKLYGRTRYVNYKSMYTYEVHTVIPIRHWVDEYFF